LLPRQSSEYFYRKSYSIKNQKASRKMFYLRAKKLKFTSERMQLEIGQNLGVGLSTRTPSGLSATNHVRSNAIRSATLPSSSDPTAMPSNSIDSTQLRMNGKSPIRARCLGKRS